MRAQLVGGAQWHRGADAELARFVGGRGHDAAARRVAASADDHRLAAELRAAQQLDRREERVHVEVEDAASGGHDVGECATGWASKIRSGLWRPRHPGRRSEEFFRLSSAVAAAQPSGTFRAVYPLRGPLGGRWQMKRAGRVLIGVVAALVVSAGALADGTVLMPAAKTDNGLGTLPHYSQWREPWMYATPAEKVDSGLGSLPHYSQWHEPWLYSQPAEKIDNGLGEIAASRRQVPAPAGAPEVAASAAH